MWVCVDGCVYSSVVLLRNTDNTFQGSLYSWKVRVFKLMRAMVVSMCV